MTVDVLLLSWRESAAQMAACAEGLRDALGADWRGRVVLVENGGTTAGRAAVRRLTDDVVVLRSEANLGFARAMDLALARARSPYALLVNTDGRPGPGMVDALVAALDARPDAVAAAPAVSGEGEPCHEPGPPAETDELAGTALLVRREAFLALGAFDPLFFFYNEDRDASRRVRAAGAALLRVPAVRFEHDRSGRSRRGRLVRELHYARTDAALVWVHAARRRDALRRLVVGRPRSLAEHLCAGRVVEAAGVAAGVLVTPGLLLRAEHRRRRPWDGARLQGWLARADRPARRARTMALPAVLARRNPADSQEHPHAHAR